MKKKRILAFALAASMVFANIAWADVGTGRRDGSATVRTERVKSGHKETIASPSNAGDKIATTSNALYTVKTDAQEFTATLGYRETALVGGEAKVYVTLTPQPQKDQYIRMEFEVTEPDGNIVKRQETFSHFYWEDEEIYNSIWDKEGTYKFSLSYGGTQISNELTVDVTRKEYKAALKAKNAEYQFGETMYLLADLDRITGETVTFGLEEKRPGSEFREINSVSFRGYNGGSKEIAIFENGYNIGERKPGKYEYRLVDGSGKVVSDTVSITVSKIQKLLVKPAKVLFETTYGIPETDRYVMLSQRYRKEFTAVNPATGKAYSGDLTNVYLKREEGLDPGEYKLLSAYSDECASIEFEGEFAKFVVQKRKYGGNTEREVYAIADGKEQVIDLQKVFYLYEANKELPDSTEILKLSDEERRYFKDIKTSGVQLHFALNPTGDQFAVDIPLRLEGKYMEFPEMTIHLKVNWLEHVEKRTAEEIRNFKSAHPFSLVADTYDVYPNIASEEAGKLSGKSRKNILNALNFYRYIAGIPADVEYDEELEYYAQAGTTLLTKVGELTHYPDQPSGVSDAFYEDGYKGTSSSNLGMGYSNLTAALKNGWMNDGDASNIDRVGHRSWCLNPHMGKTGFGHSGQYTSMYSLDESGTGKVNPAYVQWPAQTMPVEYFSGPWSVYLKDFNYFEFLSDQDSDDITVTLNSNGKTYTMTADDKDVHGKYMNVDTAYDVIVFQPGVRFSAGSKVEVTISGIKNRYGADSDITYTVEFFSLGGSSGGGGSSSGGGGGSSSGGGGGSSYRPSKSGNDGKTASLPDYVVKGNWSIDGAGNWKFSDSAGTVYMNRWAAVENPYANAELGQQAFDWFFFDTSGNMLTGWHAEADGNWYYLNPNSDGTRGKMVTGWNWITDQNGVKKCYYFNPNSDGFRGKMIVNTVIDGKTINENGEWTVDGVVQIQ